MSDACDDHAGTPPGIRSLPGGRQDARMVTKWVMVLALVAVTLTACSNRQSATNRRGHPGSTTAAAQNGVQQVTLTVGDDFRFDPSTVTVHPGQVKITLIHNGHGAPHDFSVNAFPADHTGLVSAGQTTSTTFTTPSPGTYTFVCTLHVAQGMTGKLVVLPN